MSERRDMDILLPPAIVIPGQVMAKLDTVTNGQVRAIYEQATKLNMENPAREIWIYAMTVGLLGEIVERYQLHSKRSAVKCCAAALADAVETFLPSLGGLRTPQNIEPVPFRVHMESWAGYVREQLRVAGVRGISVEEGVDGSRDMHERLTFLRDEAVTDIFDQLVEREQANGSIEP